MSILISQDIDVFIIVEANLSHDSLKLHTFGPFRTKILPNRGGLPVASSLVLEKASFRIFMKLVISLLIMVLKSSNWMYGSGRDTSKFTVATAHLVTLSLTLAS
ncbi:hypothetical protein TNCV_1481011 [Trichonephila clavipes]|nr:hypothetical protein TNCV_1481011 [Trichonephila clavipes]